MQNKKFNRFIFKNKKSQISFFIIIAIIICFLILSIIIFNQKIKPNISNNLNPNSFIESCVSESLNEALEIIKKNGGFIEIKNGVMYKDENINFLCYTPRFYEPCLNQNPLLIEKVESEIKKYSEEKINQCFYNYKKINKKKFKIEVGDNFEINITLKPERIDVKVKKEMEISKEDEKNRYEEFNYEIISQIYNILKVAVEIINQESNYCNFDNLGFMIFYPSYEITKIKTGESNTIYSISEINSGETFKFAVRSCVLPAGI